MLFDFPVRLGSRHPKGTQAKTNPSRIFYKGEWYATVEHAYQAAKTDDIAEKRAIRKADTPGQAKRLGREVKHLRKDWETKKVQIMFTLLFKKFADPDLKRKIISLIGRDLVEGNNHGDRYWGQCPLGKGSNMLGQLLMVVRDTYNMARTA